jgi:hypothetical protein
MPTGSARFLACLVLLTLSTGFAEAQPHYTHRLIDNTCNPVRRLFIEQAVEDAGYLDYMIGTARATGCYRTILQETIRDERLTCPALTVTRAPRFFQKAFREPVEDGNTVNRLDKTGQLVLALSFERLTASEISRIKAATHLHPVSLTLLKPLPSERALPNCDSLFKTLRVERTVGRK